MMNVFQTALRSYYTQRESVFQAKERAQGTGSVTSSFCSFSEDERGLKVTSPPVLASPFNEKVHSVNGYCYLILEHIDGVRKGFSDKFHIGDRTIHSEKIVGLLNKDKSTVQELPVYGGDMRTSGDIGKEVNMKQDLNQVLNQIAWDDMSPADTCKAFLKDGPSFLKGFTNFLVKVNIENSRNASLKVDSELTSGDHNLMSQKISKHLYVSLFELVNYILEGKVDMLSRTPTKCINKVFKTLSFGLPEIAELERNANYAQIDEPFFELVCELISLNVSNLEFTDEELESIVTVNNGFFIRLLIASLQCSDFDERQYVKVILHRLYGRFMGARIFFRDLVAERLSSLTDRTCLIGISELLELFSSIVNGFVEPVREEHLAFFKKNVLPLEQHPGCLLYLDNLVLIMKRYVNKEPSLAGQIFKYLNKHWPIRFPKLQLAYIRQVDEILAILSEQKFEKNCTAIDDPEVSRQVFCICKKALETEHRDLIEKTLALFNNQGYVYSVNHNYSTCLRHILPPLNSISQTFWEAGTSQLASRILLFIERFNPNEYADAQSADLFFDCVDDSVESKEENFEEPSKVGMPSSDEISRALELDAVVAAFYASA